MPELKLENNCDSQVVSDKTIYQDVLQLWKNRESINLVILI